MKGGHYSAPPRCLKLSATAGRSDTGKATAPVSTPATDLSNTGASAPPLKATSLPTIAAPAPKESGLRPQFRPPLFRPADSPTQRRRPRRPRLPFAGVVVELPAESRPLFHGHGGPPPCPPCFGPCLRPATERPFPAPIRRPGGPATVPPKPPLPVAAPAVEASLTAPAKTFADSGARNRRRLNAPSPPFISLFRTRPPVSASVSAPPLNAHSPLPSTAPVRGATVPPKPPPVVAAPALEASPTPPP